MRNRTSSIITLIIALLCIAVYAAALLYGGLRMYLNITERRNTAEREFYELVELASQTGGGAFMDEKYQETIQNALGKSRALQALIIAGPAGDFAFEKERGSLISWEGDSPRFIRKFGVSSQALFEPLRIEGLRNVTLSAVSGYLDYDYFITILKEGLLVVIGALALAFLTLILESLFVKSGTEAVEERDKPPKTKKSREKKPAGEEAAGSLKDDIFDDDDIFEDFEESREAPQTPPSPSGGHKGRFSPRSNLGWEDHTLGRLETELKRCASFGQDLTVILMEFRRTGVETEGIYKDLAESALRFFKQRDLTFERGERGIAVVFPGIGLEQGLAQAEEFHARLPESLTDVTDLYMGLSARTGRQVDAERLFFEAAQALTRASKEPVSPIVAFKIDPEKYRAFVAAQNNERGS